MPEKRDHWEERYRQLIEVCPDPILLCREDRITYINRAGTEMLGAPAEELIGASLLEQVPPQRQAGMHQRLQKAVSDNRQPLGEEQVVRADGTILDVELATALLHEDDGPSLLIVLRDITRRKRAEEDLRRSEARIRAVLDTAADGIITIDSYGIIETVNPAAERLFGYTAAELIGRNVSLLMPSPYREQHDVYLSRYLATGERHIIGIGREVQGRRKDGSIFPVDLGVAESVVEGERRFTGMIRDLSARKQAEQQIREQASLLERVRDAIMVRNLDDVIQFWNRGAERLYGWKAKEVLGRKASDVLYREPCPQLEEAMRALLENEEWNGELTQTTKDGQAVIVQSHWSLLRDDRGQPAGKLVINIDITERKELERRFLRAQRLESIGTLAGGIAHDLNNVLTPILMAVKLLQKDRPITDKQALLKTAQASVERGTQMVKQLLSFAGGVEGEREALDLVALVQEVADILMHTLPKSITIHTRFSDSLWSVPGDATQLSQVLMNLCINARDAMLEGGTIMISAQNTYLSNRYVQTQPEAKPGPHILLTVTDTGTGIPPEILEKVFDPFFTTKEFGKGTGLGLSTALGIVRSHGGFMNLYSEVGKGTTISVYLPAMEIAGAERVPRGALGSLEGRGELILLVDDEESILATAREVLEIHGYRVLTANGGKQAVRLYHEHLSEVRVVILDMMMPEMDGPATMRALQQIDAGVRIIASSGLRISGRVTEVTAAGARAFLQKPYSDEVLLATVRDVLADTAQPPAPV